MSRIYDQLKEKFIIKSAWDDWKKFRDELTALVNEYAGGRLAIVGAGRCNDIELAKLEFESIRLIDVDEEAMRAAVKCLDDSVSQKINVTEVSLTGITEEDTERFCEEVLGFVRDRGRSLTAASFEDCINSGLDKLEKKLEGTQSVLDDIFYENAYDVVLANGLFSQLFTMISFFIRSIVSSVAAEIIPGADKIGMRTERRLMQMNSFVIPMIDKALVRSAGRVAIFGNEDPPDSRVEGAYQSICFLRENYEPDERKMNWNFNHAEDVLFHMKMQIIEK